VTAELKLLAASACFRSGEIRILDSIGNVERTIAFNDTNRRL
jgi:hypothetical protein